MTTLERMLLAYVSGFILSVSFDGSLTDCNITGALCALIPAYLGNLHGELWGIVKSKYSRQVNDVRKC